MAFILASGSPRRRELLEMIGIKDFKVVPDTSDEYITPGLSPEQTVCGIALQKAKNVSQLCATYDIITATPGSAEPPPSKEGGRGEALAPFDAKGVPPAGGGGCYKILCPREFIV